jgi:hypothetical protein
MAYSICVVFIKRIAVKEPAGLHKQSQTLVVQFGAKIVSNGQTIRKNLTRSSSHAPVPV